MQATASLWGSGRPPGPGECVSLEKRPEFGAWGCSPVLRFAQDCCPNGPSFVYVTSHLSAGMLGVLDSLLTRLGE